MPIAANELGPHGAGHDQPNHGHADPTGNPADPQHTFLCSDEVFLRYRWKRTKGYQMLMSPGFPRPIGGRYRLDTLIAWEARVLAGDLEHESPPAHRHPGARRSAAGRQPRPPTENGTAASAGRAQPDGPPSRVCSAWGTAECLLARLRLDVDDPTERRARSGGVRPDPPRRAATIDALLADADGASSRPAVLARATPVSWRATCSGSVSAHVVECVAEQDRPGLFSGRCDGGPFAEPASGRSEGVRLARGDELGDPGRRQLHQ